MEGRYKPLDPRKHGIRLFRITSNLNDASGPLEGSLETVSLDDNPNYIAISYEWGKHEHGEENVIQAVID
jgi:hypothetical protein